MDIDACQHVRRLELKLCNRCQVSVPEVVHAEPKGGPAAHALFVQWSPNTQSAAVTPNMSKEHWQLPGEPTLAIGSYSKRESAENIIKPHT